MSAVLKDYLSKNLEAIALLMIARQSDSKSKNLAELPLTGRYTVQNEIKRQPVGARPRRFIVEVDKHQSCGP